MPEDSVDGVGREPESVAPPGRPNRTVTPAIAGALVVLAASFALSVAFVLANGGLDLPAAERPSASAGLAAGPTISPVQTATSSPTLSPAPPSSSPSPSHASPPTPRPSASAVAPSPSPSPPLPTPRPSSNRYDLLTSCPGTPDCWVYVVREGDNLFSIARYFGIPLEIVHERNPSTKDTQLVAGQKLRLPAPTR